jgi:hypothetical protein
MVPLLDFKLIGTIFLPDTTFLTLGCLHVLSSHEQCTVIAHSFHASTTLKLKTEKKTIFVHRVGTPRASSFVLLRVHAPYEQEVLNYPVETDVQLCCGEIGFARTGLSPVGKITLFWLCPSGF